MSPDALLSLSSLKELPASELNQLITSLIEAERQPGGPYLLTDDVSENVRLNFHIYKLFSQTGKELPKTLEYIKLFHQQFTANISSESESASPPNSPAPQDTHSFENKKVYQKALEILDKHLSPELHQHIQPTLKAIYLLDRNGEISRLAEHYRLSISTTAHQSKAISKNDPDIQFGLANMFTWLAYSLYDHSLDESANPLDITAANILQRLAVSTYRNAGIAEEKINRAFTEVDTALSQEHLYCRGTNKRRDPYLKPHTQPNLSFQITPPTLISALSCH